ncbi:MAG: tripartite tricarboxylate transporter substrate binding protein [Desulfobacteraceae bacterium]|nr:MAG: tripartite tricarboxylate transporter substrate binding protein [Desulfobacteraceae bacterium]
MKGRSRRVAGMIAGLVFVFSAALATAAAPALADDFPTRPIEYIVIFAAGGSTDLAARAIGEVASKQLGQPVVVMNKPGGGGTVGTAALAKAKPDGHTVGSLSTGAMEFKPHMEDLSYDPLKDIVAVMQYGEYPQGIAVKADSPFKTLKDLIEYARANPGKVTYGTTGAGGAQHISMERLAKEAGIKWSHVPFKGGTPAITDLLGGHITATAVAEFVPQVKAGNARLLAVFNSKRLASFPEGPTTLELGYKVYMANYLGIGVPAGTPKARIEKLAKAFKNAMDDPSFKKVMENFSIEIVYRSGEELAGVIKEGYETQGKVLRELGLAK